MLPLSSSSLLPIVPSSQHPDSSQNLIPLASHPPHTFGGQNSVFYAPVTCRWARRCQICVLRRRAARRRAPDLRAPASSHSSTVPCFQPDPAQPRTRDGQGQGQGGETGKDQGSRRPGDACRRRGTQRRSREDGAGWRRPRAGGLRGGRRGDGAGGGGRGGQRHHRELPRPGRPRPLPHHPRVRPPHHPRRYHVALLLHGVQKICKQRDGTSKEMSTPGVIARYIKQEIKVEYS